MKKDSKLTEKGVRMPDIREVQRDEIIKEYLQDVERLNNEASRLQRFSMLLQPLLGYEPGFIDKYCGGFETYLKVRNKDRILKGRADNLYGNVIIEFEANLLRTRTEAEEQLRRYVAILWSQESPASRTPYLCLAGDGIQFISFTPTLANPNAQHVAPDEVHLHELEKVDWKKTDPADIFFWLDRYFLRQEIYTPTSEKIEADFGPKSHAFQTANASLLALWRQVKDRSVFAVVYEAWDKYLRIVYGSEVAGDELFVRHTYLATLAKLMAWMRLTESSEPPPDDQTLKMLEGRLFKDLGINNFLEEDFFSWVARSPADEVTLKAVRGLFSILRKYRMRELSEDVLKSLYQELVDPETRHDLGEFYTPDWLADRMVHKMMDANERGAMLDPACGSGTFLYLAIKEKKRRLGDSKETLKHILEAVCGADIHPLAVITAKTNYILALGDLLEKRPGPVSIPVFLADTNFLPQREIEASRKLWRKLPGYRVHLDKGEFHLPDLLLQDLDTYDRAIELTKDFAYDHRGKSINLQGFRNLLKVKNFPRWEDHELTQALLDIAQKLKAAMEDKRDTIWAFILKNIFKPLFFKDRFDFILGNPPWIAFRYLEPAYQEKMKTRIIREYRLLSGRGELITHLEIGTLFLVRAADLYLKPGGVIGFVLPRAIFTADQHDNLRREAFKFSQDDKFKVFWTELWDCDQVAPLFNVPGCVLWGEKQISAPQVRESLRGQVLSGKLPRKNASLSEAEENLTVTDTEFSLHRRGRRSYWAPGAATLTKYASPYKKQFFQGATIVPRSFWFVQVQPSRFGIDLSRPPLTTDPRAIKEAKAPYKEVKLSGNVESRFLYATLLSTDLLPFGHLDYRLVVLPIEPKGKAYHLFDYIEARRKGFSDLAQWLGKVEEEWQGRRTSKAERLSALDWLDYRKKLTGQNPKAKFWVIYNKSGTFLTATKIERNPIEFGTNGQKITNGGFLPDHVTYYSEVPSEKEAYYLVSILNAPKIDQLLTPMKTRGAWGPRDIHKKVLELPIPQFDTENHIHLHLAKLAEHCEKRVSEWLSQGGPGKVKSIGRLRQMVRQMLKAELEEIDSLVQQILD